ncbi:unnamed protein product [Adineta steineri]|uniref:SHSP domain-containing protein n=1 Tax=Adineta steineri TaxID=433720 RepID=A0A815PHR3_9BILA|nr:unnamed protein product [Adineta steineri]CAF3820586.1 unnamed protein product [Adineta steineri]
MLVTSSQSSTQRPLGLSVEELYALDRQYRRIEQQQQHLSQLQNQAHLTPSNLNRLASRSLDFISSKQTPLTALPSLEIHGHAYSYRPQHPSTSAINYPRSHSIDQLRYNQPTLTTPTSALLKSPHHQRSTSTSTTNDSLHQRYHTRHRTYLQHPSMATGNTPSLGNNVLHNIPPSPADQYDMRNSCKLRRQHPIKRESSRRIVVRPVVQRRREPSISSSCESLDEQRSPMRPLPTEQFNYTNQSVPFTPSSSLTTNVINELQKETTNLIRTSSNNESLSDDNDVNLYEMRIPIGKTYDTSDISVQLEGPKILIHCHTIEPTDKRGNYRKHEFKTELLVPDVVDDETIVAYLTEDGQLIVEGKYHAWAWKEIKRKRKLDQQQQDTNLIITSPILLPPPAPLSKSSTDSNLISTRTDGSMEQDKIQSSLVSNKQRIVFNNNNNYINYNNNNNNNNNNFNDNNNNNNNNDNNNDNNTNNNNNNIINNNNHINPTNRIEKLDNNRTVIYVGEPSISQQQQHTDTRSVSDIINRFNTFNTTSAPAIWDGQYTFTNDNPPFLIYHIRLPFEASTDSIRIQSDPQLHVLKIFIEQQERSLLPHQQQSKVIIRSTSRICRLPRDHMYDYTRLHVVFLKDNYLRIELPTIN